MSRVLVFDPSGNFENGKGTSGWALFENGELEDFGDIDADDFKSAEAYWRAHIELMNELDIHHVRGDTVVCESFRLQATKAMAQSWSSMETPQLIGIIRYHCFMEGIKFVFQAPSDKTRVADPQLVKMGVLETKKYGAATRYFCNGLLTNDHMRDAIRHGVFFHRYGKGRAPQK